MAVLGAPVFPHGNLAFFVAIFSEMTRLSAGVGLRLHSIHPSITRESKWRYIMKKINLRELYPDVYTTDFFEKAYPAKAWEQPGLLHFSLKEQLMYLLLLYIAI